jgi:hypothetical protein
MFNFTSQNNCDGLVILYLKHATEAYNFCLRVHQEIAKNIKRKSLSKEKGVKKALLNMLRIHLQR